MRSGVIFINMKTTTIILTFAQIEHLLTNLSVGYQIRSSVKDLNKIIDRAKNRGK